MARTCDCGSLKMLRKHIGKSFKTLHFWLSDQRSHWVHRKANTIKRGWGFDHELVAQVLEDIALKTLNHILTSPSIKTLSQTRSHQNINIRTHRVNQDRAIKPNPRNSVQLRWHSVPPKYSDQVSVTQLFHFGITELNWSELPRRGSA